MFMVCQTCPYDFFKNQYSGFLQVQVTEWVNGFLWIILGLYLLIESSLVCLHTRASATCVLSVHQMEAVVVGNFYVNLLAQMCTDYSTPVVSLLVGQHYRATRRVFGKKVFQFVSVCLQSSWVPALRESSCLSGTAALFSSDIRAKMLCVALQ